MPRVTYRLRGKPFEWSGGGWVFVRLPKAQAREIRGIFAGLARGASLPVTVRVGATTWRTSIFGEAASQGYLLPLKADVRRAEGIKAGKAIAYELTVEA